VFGRQSERKSGNPLFLSTVFAVAIFPVLYVEAAGVGRLRETCLQIDALLHIAFSGKQKAAAP
jgi:hypothetical protein